MKDVVLKDRSTSNYGLNPGTDKHLEHYHLTQIVRNGL